MTEKKKIYKPKAISGYPEWLPEERLIEQQWLDKIRAVYERYGYCNIETPCVEELDVIAAKGEDVDKEIYVLERLHKDEDDKKEARLALHFDQTVPLARYTAQHFNDLTFPFKRYQMQKVWRGERPQMGRMREFYQCDIDVINIDKLPIHFDAEVASICYEALASLDIGRVQLRISNRKILMGLLDHLNVENKVDITRIIDKIEKITTEQYQTLMQEHGASQEQITAIQTLVNCKDLNTLEAKNAEMTDGIEELKFVMAQLSHLPEHAAIADLSIVRGLDYYTGTVYETQLLDAPEFTGSVCSGGRYDDLASSYINKKLPGVGISIGFSRLFDVMRQTGRLETKRKSPADILMVMPNEDMRGAASEAARTLRDRGYRVELSHGGKLKKQLAYASEKAIPYVWFPPFEDGLDHEVKDMETGDQTKASPKDWTA